MNLPVFNGRIPHLNIDPGVEGELVGPMDETMHDVIPDLRQVVGNVLLILQNALEIVLGNMFVQSVAIQKLSHGFLLRRRISDGIKNEWELE